MRSAIGITQRRRGPQRRRDSASCPHSPDCSIGSNEWPPKPAPSCPSPSAHTCIVTRSVSLRRCSSASLREPDSSVERRSVVGEFSSRCVIGDVATIRQQRIQNRRKFAAPAGNPPIDSPRPSLHSTRVFGGARPVDGPAGERGAGGKTGAAAEGATAPESLRQKDRRPTTLWKASAFAWCGGGPPKG